MSDETQVTTNNTAILVEGNLLACGAVCLRKAVTTSRTPSLHISADKAFDAEKQSREWYDKFIDVMRDLGFTIPRRTFELETSAELSVTVGAVAVRAIGVAGSALLGAPARCSGQDGLR
jgi:aspartate-semialdehyde dehydrogenase